MVTELDSDSAIGSADLVTPAFRHHGEGSIKRWSLESCVSSVTQIQCCQFLPFLSLSRICSVFASVFVCDLKERVMDAEGARSDRLLGRVLDS